LATFFTSPHNASGLHTNSRCPAVRQIKGQLSRAAKPRSKVRTVPQPCGWFSVGGLASKPNSHPLTQRVCVPAPSLHGGYPLLRYCRSVRLPYGAASRVMHSPRALAALPATPPGLPGSSTDLSPCAVPNHPGEPDGCSLPLLPRRCQASSRMADWPLPLYITRPNRVHLCYGYLLLTATSCFPSSVLPTRGP
jgi:hypothetical protein